MDIQQILAATGGPSAAPSGAKGQAPGSLTGADFAKALASLSPAAGGAPPQGTTDGDAPRAMPGTLRRALETMEAQGQAMPEGLKALLASASSGEGLPESFQSLLPATDGEGNAAAQLQALLSSAAEDGELPEGLQRLLSGASSMPMSEALLARLTAAQGTEGGEATDAESAAPETAAGLQAIMQRLALIQGAGQTTAEGGAAAIRQAGQPPAAGSPGAESTNPLLQAAQGRGEASSTAAAALSTAEAARQGAGTQLGSPQAPPPASSQASPQAMLEALTARREGQAGSGQGHQPPAVGPLGAAGQPGPTTLAGNASAPATPQQATLSAPVDSPAWPRQLGQQLIRFGRGGGEQHIEMKLHPAELGPLSVTLKVGDQGAQAHFLSAHAQVRQTLEQALPQLREALAEQGIALGETSVGEQQQGDTQADGQRFADTGGSGSGGDDEPASASQAIESTRGRDIPLDGRVDLYA